MDGLFLDRLDFQRVQLLVEHLGTDKHNIGMSTDKPTQTNGRNEDEQAGKININKRTERT